jgi:hypothetical protein
MMLTAHLTNQYARVLYQVWEGDDALLNTWHASAPCDLPTAVRDSVGVLLGDEVDPDFAFYELWQGTDVVGFLGIEPASNFVITFGVRSGFRTPEIKDALWEYMRTFTDPNEPACCILHRHNVRAQRFLEAHGAHLVNDIVHGEKHGKLYLLNP